MHWCCLLQQSDPFLSFPSSPSPSLQCCRSLPASACSTHDGHDSEDEPDQSLADPPLADQSLVCRGRTPVPPSVFPPFLSLHFRFPTRHISSASLPLLSFSFSFPFPAVIPKPESTGAHTQKTSAQKKKHKAFDEFFYQARKLSREIEVQRGNTGQMELETHTHTHTQGERNNHRGSKKKGETTTKNISNELNY